MDNQQQQNVPPAQVGSGTQASAYELPLPVGSPKRKPYVYSDAQRLVRNAQGRAWNKRNREKRRKIMANWRARHPGYFAAMVRRQRAKDPVKAMEYKRQYRANNQEKIKAYTKRYARENPHVFVANAARRRARKAAATIRPALIKEFYKLVRRTKRIRCYYCREWIKAQRHVEHVIPLDKGGAHSIENLCVSCQHCNQTKSIKLIGQWQPEAPQQILL